jgi:hypothetical protein
MTKTITVTVMIAIIAYLLVSGVKAIQHVASSGITRTLQVPNF